MKKIYLLLSFALMSSLAIGQVSFTFEVDMNDETVSADGVHVAGNWQAANGGSADWQPGDDEMLDGDGDGIYTLTIDVPAGGYEFKFINGNSWDGVEGVPAVSQVGYGNDNRYFMLTEAGYDSSGAIPFSGSAPAGYSAVKFQVDIDGGADTIPHVAGDAFMPNWTPDATPLYNVSNNIHAVTYFVADGDYDYKFLTENAWGSDETAIPDSCSNGGNRELTVAGADTVLDAVCFNACGPCAVSSQITFKVDMNLSCIDVSTDPVNLMGTVTDWSAGAAMTDDDADGVWEITVGVQPGDWEYKFRVGGDVWEGISNRALTVVEGEDQELEVDCWNSTEACNSGAFDPAPVTFIVDVSDSTLDAGEKVWVMGDFTSPTWQDGAIEMTDNGDGTWTTTVADFCPQEGRYKFAYGVEPNGDGWTEENAEFAQEGGCGEDNGSFPDNRVLVRSSNDGDAVCFIFNTCDECATSVAELEMLNEVEIFPNPATDAFQIVFKQFDTYTVRILDISGKMVYNNLFNADRLRIEEDMVSGVYFIQIADSYDNTITRKLVIK